MLPLRASDERYPTRLNDLLRALDLSGAPTAGVSQASSLPQSWQPPMPAMTAHGRAVPCATPRAPTAQERFTAQAPASPPPPVSAGPPPAASPRIAPTLSPACGMDSRLLRSAPLYSAAWAFVGARLATCSNDKTFLVWDSAH